MAPQHPFLVRIFGPMSVPLETIFSPKIITKVGCCGAKFSNTQVWERFFLLSPKKQFLKTCRPEEGKIQSANAQYSKIYYFFRHPVQNMSETLWSPFGVSIQACGTRYSGWYKLLAKDKRKSAEPFQTLICWKNGSKLANWGAWKERARKDVQNFFLASNLTRSHLASGSINTWPAWPTSPASLLPNQARYCNTMPASSTVSSTSISFSTTLVLLCYT